MKIKVVIVQCSLPHYRVDFFNLLSEFCDLFVIHSGERKHNNKFAEITLNKKTLFGVSFMVGLKQAIGEIDPQVLVVGDHLRCIQLPVLRMFSVGYRTRLVWWGLSKSSYRIVDFIKEKLFILDKDVIIFYDQSTKIQFESICNNRCFVANNTVSPPDRKVSVSTQKKSFLNVGSLDARKQNDVLLNVFRKLVDDVDSDLILYLVGGGAECDRLLSCINSMGLDGNVFLLGEITDSVKLYDLYSQSYASVSFGQAGLAVLQSMSFGVPYVTKHNAISGGEISNIINGYNGILCDDNGESLYSVLKDIVLNKDDTLKMGLNALHYYNNSASLDLMVRAFMLAIEMCYLNEENIH